MRGLLALPRFAQPKGFLLALQLLGASSAFGLFASDFEDS
jgi:hypothetical protein